MSRRIDQIQRVLLSFMYIFHLDGMAFNGNATLPLQIHIVEHLPFGDLYRIRIFKQTVGQSRLTVIYMC